MSVVTGSGDKGNTSLFSGERVPKTIQQIEACGDVDELNSVLGMLAAAMDEKQQEVRAEIHRIQSSLFHVGAWLATTPGSPQEKILQSVEDSHIRKLEEAIDRMETALPPLKGFILPGGVLPASWAHLARTVCRRAERRVVNLVLDSERQVANERLSQSLRYLNRLSDYLFVLARRLNHNAGVDDVLWEK